MLRMTALGAIASLLLFGFAWAQEPMLTSETAPAADTAAAPTPDAYGYTADDVAVNQAVVAYWYAHGYANCYGCFPTKWADLAAKNLPLRKFMSPHTGDEINLDDGVLDFDGDMIYLPAQCDDVQIKVKTTKGEVVIPGYISGNSDLSAQFSECCQRCLSTGCAEVSICGIDYWGGCNKCGSCSPCAQPAPCNDCVCKMMQWMLWKSFELHEKLYGTRPVDELAWFASGLAPFDKNYKELAPFMDVEFIYKGNCNCSVLKKAYVHCCQPCQTKCGSCEKPSCNSCAKPKCGSCGKPDCNTCKPKCDAKAPCGKCNKCKQNTCAKPKCGSCGKPDCNSCAKPKCGKCGKPDCNTCKPKCGGCGKPDCNTCKPKCDAKAPCGKCNKCKQNTCTKPGCSERKPCGKCG